MANKSTKRSATSNGAKKKTKAKSAPKKRAPKAIDRPFDKAIWNKAKIIAEQYRLLVERDEDDCFIGCTVEMPLVFGDGETIEKCAAETLEATTTAIATLLELGENPPSPASESKREHQMNIRLTSIEKIRLEEAARQRGFRSVSDYVRTSALDAS